MDRLLRMEETGAICFRSTDTEKKLLFDNIMQNKELVQGEVWVTRQALCQAGGVNELLEEGRTYELLLRIAQCYRIIQADIGKKNVYLSDGKIWMLMERDVWIPDASENKRWKTECYLIGRYKKELMAESKFDDAVMRVISSGSSDAAKCLEQMLKPSAEFHQLYDYTQPILIYTGEEICYRVLDTFAKNMGRALEEHGCHIIYFNLAVQKPSEIAYYLGMRLKAVIGMQTYMFSLKKKDGQFIHDLMDAPEYHFIFDHPVWLRNHLLQCPQRMTLLTPDRNYAMFIERFYGRKALFFPPAGREYDSDNKNRQYDISFLGTYDDSLLDDLKELYKTDRKKAYMVSRYVCYLRRDLTETPEKALQKLLDYYNIQYTDKEFEGLFFSVYWVVLKLAHYYRKKTIEGLLEAGLTIHVFGESWKNSPLRLHRNLICHKQAIGEEALKVYAGSKLALNIMTWHKAGFTERIANAMLQKAVVVSDQTAYLRQHFIDGEDMILFRLDRLKELPQRLKCLLADDSHRQEMAERGYQKAVRRHTWKKRAEELLLLIKEQE